MIISPKTRIFLSILMIPLLFACKGQQGISGSHTTAEENTLRKKYALLIGVDEKEITNLSLYEFIDQWYGVPYKSAGKTKDGVDCSGFVSILYAQVYKKTIGGPATALFSVCEIIPEKNLKEGDLVFFKINSEKVSHVGVYLQNRHFVHASTHKGVIISSLDEEYYKKYFFKGGRVK